MARKSDQLRKLLSYILALSLLAGSFCTKQEELDGEICCDCGGRICEPKPRGPFEIFFVLDRRADAPDTLAAYQEVETERIAESDHFYLYRSIADAGLISESEAKQILFDLEPVYDGLSSVYGAGREPNVGANGKITLLATDIIDDYDASNPAFVAGYFSPPDMYSDDFVQDIYYNLANKPNYFINETSLSIPTLATLAGRSNQNDMIYLDLNPLYNGEAFEGDQAAAYDFFLETAIHELSHLFTFYDRVYKRSRDNHDSWIAEGIAQQAPMLLDGRFAAMEQSLETFGSPVIQSYLTDGASLIGLDSTGSSLAGYVQSNLFFNYLRHRSGTINQEEIIDQVIAKNDPGAAGTDAAAKTVFGTLDWQDLFSDWVVTNFVQTSGKSANSIQKNDIDQNTDDYTYENVGLLAAGETGRAFPEDSLPLSISDSSVQCLNPGAYIYFEYTVKSGEEGYTPTSTGMNQGLGIAMASPVGTTRFDIIIDNPDNQFGLNTFATGTKLNFMVYNPNLPDPAKSAAQQCLAVGLLPWDTRHIADWLGSNQVGWKKTKGAVTAATPYADGFFIRPTGIATALKLSSAPSKNYVYVADKSKHAIMRFDLDTGQFEGLLGSSYLGTCSNPIYTGESDCTTNMETWDPCGDTSADLADQGWHNDGGKILVPNHCRSSLGEPQGIDVAQTSVGEVDEGDIFIADRSNHRIVWRDSNGDFVGWLGSLDSESWQCGSTSANLKCTNAGGGNQDYDPIDLLGPLPSKVKRGIQSPYDIVVDAENDYLYIASFGSNRVVRRQLSTGAFAGYIGNGENDGFATGNDPDDVTPISGPQLTHFKEPTGLDLDLDDPAGPYLYVTDKSNHRISRWTLDGSETPVVVGNNTDGWHSSTSTQAGTDQLRFNFPFHASVDNNFLYIADTTNQRIVRRRKSNGLFRGWIGGGIFTWETNIESAETVEGNTDVAPPFIMKAPEHSFFLPKSQTGLKHSYLLITARYNARLLRWNLDCVADPENETACQEE